MGRHKADDSSSEREILLALIEEQQLNRELMSLVLFELRLIKQLLGEKYKAPVSATITVTKTAP